MYRCNDSNSVGKPKLCPAFAHEAITFLRLSPWRQADSSAFALQAALKYSMRRLYRVSEPQKLVFC